MAHHKPDFAAARKHAQAALDTFGSLNDEHGVTESTHLLASIALFSGDSTLARRLQADELLLRRASGDAWGMAVLLMEQGHLEAREGNVGLANALLTESLSLYRDAGDMRRAMFTLENLAHVAILRGDLSMAGPYLEESYALASRLDDRWSMPRLLESCAQLAAAQGNWDRALRLLAASSSLLDTYGIPRWPAFAAGPLSLADQARAAIGEAAEHAWRAGRAMTLEQAFRLAFEDVQPGV